MDKHLREKLERFLELVEAESGIPCMNVNTGDEDYEIIRSYPMEDELQELVTDIYELLLEEPTEEPNNGDDDAC